MDFTLLAPPPARRLAIPLTVLAAWWTPACLGQAYEPDYSSRAYNPPSMSTESYTYNPTPVAVFFPPDPPPLDRMARLPVKNSTGYRHAPAPELASYVSEPFYPALAALYDNQRIKDRQLAALGRYREEKRALQHELHTELIRIRPLAATDRATELAALSRAQDPKIADLERRAEDFRTDLLKGEYTWGSIREWHLGESERYPDSAREIAGVMRAAAFFQSGLSPEQRTLLREIAIEVPTAAETLEEAAAAQPYVFFSPGPSRVLFPEDVPSDLAAKIATYQTRRSALRKRLYDVMFREDGAWFGLKRTVRLQSLAKEQAPEFAALEGLAEDIRRDLALVPPPPPPEPLVYLSPVLAQRVIALYQNQLGLQKGYFGKAMEVRQRYPALNIIVSFNRDRPSYNVSRRNYNDPVGDTQKAVAEMAALSATYNQAVANLAAEGKSLTRDLAEFLRTDDPSQMKVALAEGVRLAAQESAAPAMADYRSAVFDPGLSAGQRRLLFDYAIEQCDLPLPAGELQPRQRRTQRVGRADR